MMIGSDGQGMLMLLIQQFELPPCRYYWWDEFMKYAVEIA
jgi:hypothetical protein